MPKENQYKSPLVSCICCREVKSAKGIFSHFVTTHTEEGKRKLDDARMSSIIESKRSNESIYKSNVDLYNVAPNFCLGCNKPLSYNKRANKFCSHSCSTTFNNYKRSPGKIFKKPTNPRSGPHCKLSFCSVCGTLIKNSHNKTCSTECLRHTQSLTKKKNRKGRWNTNATWYISPSAGRVYLESSWEVTVARQLDKLGILWTRPKYLNYTLDGSRKSYYPDFYLTDYDVYLDPKNPYQQKIDRTKLVAVVNEHSIKLLILGKDDLNWASITNMIQNKAWYT